MVFRCQKGCTHERRDLRQGHRNAVTIGINSAYVLFVPIEYGHAFADFINIRQVQHHRNAQHSFETDPAARQADKSQDEPMKRLPFALLIVLLATIFRKGQLLLDLVC